MSGLQKYPAVKNLAIEPNTTPLYRQQLFATAVQLRWANFRSKTFKRK